MAKKTDLDKLQGNWNIVSLEMEGKKYPSAGAQIEVKGGRFISRNMGAEYEGVVSIDEGADPKTFDLKFDKGPEAGNASLGIYQLDGDTWTICLGLTGKKRPTEFASKAGTGHAFEVLQRDKAPAIPGPAADEHAAPVPDLEGEWKMVRCAQDGEPMDASFVKMAKREFRGNTTTLTVGGRPMMKSRFAADTTAGTLDYLDARQIGIYKRDGDKLNTAMAPVTEKRPVDFAEKKGFLVSEWKRVK